MQSSHVLQSAAHRPARYLSLAICDADPVCRLTFSGNAHAMICLSMMMTPTGLLMLCCARLAQV